MEDYYYTKDNLGEGQTKDRIQYFQEKAYESGMTQSQVKWLTGMVDHESAGSWDENIKNHTAKEHSVGIAQWNLYAGRKAPSTFEAQVDLVIEELGARFKNETIESAIGHHNMPNWDSNPVYVGKVRKAMEQFN